jgi:hypothetical protein
MSLEMQEWIEVILVAAHRTPPDEQLLISAISRLEEVVHSSTPGEGVGWQSGDFAACIGSIKQKLFGGWEQRWSSAASQAQRLSRASDLDGAAESLHDVVQELLAAAGNADYPPQRYFGHEAVKDPERLDRFVRDIEPVLADLASNRKTVAQARKELNGLTTIGDTTREDAQWLEAHRVALDHAKRILARYRS